MDQTTMTAKQPTEADHSEATALWEAIKHQDDLPSMLLALVSQKNALKAPSSKKRTSPTITPVVSKKPRSEQARKKKFEKWAKALLREAPKVKFWYDGCGFEGELMDCIVQETPAMTFEEFEDLFGRCGKNTAKTKGAVVQTRLYENLHEIRQLFGEGVFPDVVDVKMWKKRSFGKSTVVDHASTPVHSLIAKYNRTKMNVQLVFKLSFCE